MRCDYLESFDYSNFSGSATKNSQYNLPDQGFFKLMKISKSSNPRKVYCFFSEVLHICKFCFF